MWTDSLSVYKGDICIILAVMGRIFAGTCGDRWGQVSVNVIALIETNDWVSWQRQVMCRMPVSLHRPITARRQPMPKRGTIHRRVSVGHCHTRVFYSKTATEFTLPYPAGSPTLLVFMSPPLIGGGIKRWCCLTFVCLTSVCHVHRAHRMYIERPHRGFLLEFFLTAVGLTEWYPSLPQRHKSVTICPFILTQ